MNMYQELTHLEHIDILISKSRHQWWGPDLQCALSGRIDKLFSKDRLRGWPSNKGEFY